MWLGLVSELFCFWIISRQGGTKGFVINPVSEWANGSHLAGALLMNLRSALVLVGWILMGSFISASNTSAQNGGGWISPLELRRALTADLDDAAEMKLAARVENLFGRHNLVKGRPGAKSEATTVAWAIVDSSPATVVREDGGVIGGMKRLGESGLQVLALEMPNFSEVTYRVEVAGETKVAGSVRIEHYDTPPESIPSDDVPSGRLEVFEWSQSKIFPNTVRDVTVYIPKQYQAGDKACLMVWQDGSRHADPKGQMKVPVVFDHLIHSKEMPVTIGVFIDPGRKPEQPKSGKAANRGVEYDSLGDAYVTFLLTEILPEVEKRYQVAFREEPEAWGIAGGSSGGICSFTAAWERPDKFHKVLSWVGSFVDLRGGHVYPAQIRITERKPIRIYTMDGDNDLDNAYGNWPIANKRMAAALEYMGYDYRLDWTQCFHGSKGMAPLLPDALRWLWRDVK